MSILPHITRVAIIGAGPGGLAAARALRDEGAFEKITVFERNSEVGGTWIYSPQTNSAPAMPSVNALQVDPPLSPAPLEPVRSSIYTNLNTNLPKNVMSFRDVPFPSTVPLFPNRKQVLDYLTDFAASYGLLPMIRFQTTVVSVENINDKWQVSVTELREGKQNSYTEGYDAVIVASGHYYVPYIPDFKGLQELINDGKTKVLHSRDYRRPEDYHDQTVLIIGSGSSASDLVREISGVARKVYHCVRGDTDFSKRIKASPVVERVGPIQTMWPTITSEDDKHLEGVDTVIVATGYLYSFPFLPFEGKELIQDGQKVHNLYKFLFYSKNPTLAFLGLPIRVVPLPLMQSQSTVVARCWSKKITLPSEQEMLSENSDSNDRKEMVMTAPVEFDYVDHLSAWAEGWTDSDISGWQSTHPITGRLPDWWKQSRQNSLALRLESLGY